MCAIICSEGIFLVIFSWVYRAIFGTISDMNTSLKMPFEPLQTELLKAQHENSVLQQEVSTLLKQNQNLGQQVQSLQEQVEWFKKQIFGKRSERIVKNSRYQLYLEGMEPSEELVPEVKQVAAHVRRKKPESTGRNKIDFPEDLPRETTILDLAEKKKVCPETELPLVKIGEEVTQKLAYRPGSFFIKEIIRPKYAVPERSEEGVLAQELPDSFIPKSKADESLLAEVLTRKFVDHLPLYRISEGFSRDNVYISRQLLSQWVIRCGLGLQPLYDLMRQKVLHSKNIFVDESPISMLMPAKGKTHQGYMWVLCGGLEQNPAYRIYHFKTDRKHANARELIGDYRGVLHSDKYGAYEKLAQDKQITWCCCWSHIRRKFVEAESGDLEFRDWVLRKIRYLFMYERIAWKRPEEDRLKIRQEKEIPIIDELIDKIKDKLINGRILPKSKFREAMGYFYSLIPYLKNYTKHPYAKMDNNVAERAVRPLAIGRKNWLFVGSEEGGEAAGIIYSLVQTCRALKIDPREYLEDVMRRIMSHNFRRLDELLPDQWAPARS